MLTASSEARTGRGQYFFRRRAGEMAPGLVVPTENAPRGPKKSPSSGPAASPTVSEDSVRASEGSRPLLARLGDDGGEGSGDVDGLGLASRIRFDIILYYGNKRLWRVY